MIRLQGIELWGFSGGSDGKESACNAETQVRSLGREDPLVKGMATHSSILAWRIPWTEEPGGLQSTGLQRVGHDRATSLSFFHFLGLSTLQGLPWCLSAKESTCQCRRHSFDPWVGKIPWRRKWQPPPVFLPGESHGWSSLVGYSPQG